MPAARCSRCDLYMPKDRKECPVCGDQTFLDDALDHSPTWRVEADRLKKRWVFGKPLPNSQATIVERNGNHFVTDEQMMDSGYCDLEADSIVLIKDVYYEVNGPIFKNSDVPSWWITPIKGVTRGLKTLSPKAYEELNRTRYKETEQTSDTPEAE